MKLQEIVSLLKNSDIFRDIPSDVLEKNATHFETLHFENGESIIRKGEIGDSLFVIISGKVKVHDDEIVVAHMNAGDFFGEMSLLSKGTRSMSISALEHTEVVCINRNSFNKIVNSYPEVTLNIIGGLIQRLREQNTVLTEEFRSREEELKRKVEEQTLLYKKQKERAEQSEKFKQQFLANMSHEIRTPMNAVMGMTNLVLNSALQPKQKYYLEGIKKSSDHLLHIINDILDLSKVEAGKMELEELDFSLHELIEQIKFTLQQRAEEKGLQLLTSVDKNIPDVLVGDPVRLNQILINLGGNAIKFTEKGSVSLIVKCESSNVNAGSDFPPASRISFHIEDTGIGIPKEKMKTVFESFSQANASDTRKYGGTGLGLTISKQLVELMGGTISVESEEGSGSRFSFAIELPAGSAERLSQQKSTGEIDGTVLNGLKILLAEDNEYNRVVAIDTLKSKAEVEIDAAMNGREAIALLEQNDYDVVLMDVQMPELNGYDTTRKIRTEFSSPKNKIPIIALTASVIKSDLDKCKAAGMNSYVPKPFTALQLINAIAAFTGRKVNPVASTASKVVAEKKNSSVTDLTFLKSFCEGDEARMKKYIGMYLNFIPGQLEKIKAALAEKNYDQVRATAHAMKAQLNYMGMHQTRAIAELIEQTAGGKNNFENLTSMFVSLQDQCEQSFVELKSEIKE